MQRPHFRCSGLSVPRLEEKRNKFTGYLSVTAKEMLEHLLKRYGKISLVDLENNKAKLQEPINPDFPIDVYFKRIDDCLQYAADAEIPFTQKKILQTLYYTISATGVYS